MWQATISESTWSYYWIDQGEPAPRYWVHWPASYGTGDNSGDPIAERWATPDPAWRSPDGEWRPWNRFRYETITGSDGDSQIAIDRGLPPGRVVDFLEWQNPGGSPFWLGRYDFQRDHWLRAFSDLIEEGQGQRYMLAEIAAKTGFFDRFASWHDAANWRALQAQSSEFANFATPGDWIGYTIARWQDERTSEARAQTLQVIAILAAPLAYYAFLAAVTETAAAASTVTAAEPVVAAEVTLTELATADVALTVAEGEALAAGLEGAIAESAAQNAALAAAAPAASTLTAVLEQALDVGKTVATSVAGQAVTRVGSRLLDDLLGESPPAQATTAPAPRAPTAAAGEGRSPWPLVLAGLAIVALVT